MLKLSYCLRRRPDLSHEEFLSRWADHVPLVQRVAGALAVLRYVQVHTWPGRANDRLRVPRGSPVPFDGIAETWYESLEAALAAAASDQGRDAWEALVEDERRFIDFGASPIFFGQEHEIRLAVPGA